MLIVALACLALAGLTVYLALRLIRSERREFARERALILDQLLHAAGKTWSPPPARSVEKLEREPDPDRELAVW